MGLKEFGPSTHLKMFKRALLKGEVRHFSLGPRRPHGTPLVARLPVRPSVRAKNLNRLYSSIDHQKATADPLNQMFYES